MLQLCTYITTKRYFALFNVHTNQSTTLLKPLHQYVLVIYLSSAQINGNMYGSKQWRREKRMRRARREFWLRTISTRIPTQKATQMKDIVHHA